MDGVGQGSDYIIALIGVTGTLLAAMGGTLLGFWLTTLHDERKEIGRVRSGMLSALNRVRMERMGNKIGLRVNGLFDYMAENLHILERIGCGEEIDRFYQKWNSIIPPIDEEYINHGIQERRDELIRDIKNLENLLIRQ